MTLFAVTYRYAPGSDAGRDAHRPRHIEFLQGLHDAGALVVSGPSDPEGAEPGALLVVRADDAAAADDLMAADPFALEGFVERAVREWRPVFGKERLA